ncbi:putative bifunctional diguanylate cyclase/phosphodiesterase [Azospirillum rugosum]|uniref:EAL domain-containing protein (Putative c-di-GMP-specific phosphodiesterase class I) n=1 Tax=Azospirillum rugosum TaxID=416170 RepID=A0ABS4SQR5_9PROT|nr:EAL domain-containing protein [Azospirillum rugosum]MBP2294900.1 EAL domain-containing protein (putative c-di-GMP-specific phosphodiesterase class I) [Azospirillum rugosum]MDQ0528178.1 EAL domain-containing protein (putative c-di-GMP-specific phosphodiesterase class I) [Azospirillum rugosum]
MAVNQKAFSDTGTEPGLNRPTEPTLAPIGTPGTFTDRIREAIERNELRLAYQPQADVETGRLTGFEALSRWRLDDGTVIPPDVFIPMAETSDAIHLLGEWSLRRACQTAARWMHDGIADLPVAVNLSARQLDDPGLARTVLGILAETGLPAANLKLELTETALFEHSDSSREVLTRLRGAGVRLVLDDFGTGYSSLSLLRRVPVEALKIDKHFTQAMVDDRDAAAIVRAIIDMAHALGMQVIAEGVETNDQLLFLRAYRCDRIQGYLLAKPLPEDEIPDFIQHRDATPTGG